MAKTIAILGAGEGISKAVASRFGQEGYAVVLLARNEEKLAKLADELKAEGLTVTTATTDVGNAERLTAILQGIEDLEVVLYNAFVFKHVNILEEDANSLTEDFSVNVAGLLTAVKAALPSLEKRGGSVLVTGGGLALFPSQDVGSLAIGKAGIRNLAGSLAQALQARGIFVGTVTVKGYVSPEAPVHNPANIAEQFYTLHSLRNDFEIQV